MPRSPPPRPACARWRRARRASWGRRTSMSRIWSSMPAWTPRGCASGSGRAKARGALRNLDPDRLMQPGVGGGGVLAAVSTAARCVDVRDGHPSVRREMVTAMARVEFHFDFGSPNAYLSHLVIPEIERRTGATFEYVPVLLGGVFKLTNNRSPAESLAGIRNKPEYQRLETERFVARHGITRFAPQSVLSGQHAGADARRDCGAADWACSSDMWTRCSATCGRSRRRWTILMCCARH